MKNKNKKKRGKGMNGKIKRMLSILLVVTLLGSMMPLSVSAAELPAEMQNQEIVEAAQNVEESEESSQMEELQEDIPEEVPEETLEGIGEEAEPSYETLEEETAQEAQTYANGLPATIPAGETYTLSEDVTMESGQWFESIEGTLDGDGHTITLTDKPLANNVTGTIQNLGVTSENVIESDSTFGSMAVTFNGTIQNCFSTAKLHMNGFDEPGGLIGTANGGIIQNSYFAGVVTGTLEGFYGSLIGVNNSENTQLKNSCYEDKSMNGPVSIDAGRITPENVQKKTLDDFKAGAANEILNTNLPDIGFSWTTPVDGSNQGFPVLTKGDSSEPQKPDKTNLENLVNSCEGITSEGYTEESWAPFSAALTEAKTVLENEDATRDDVTNAITKLEAAKAGLKRKRPTEPVAPPADASKINHISSEEELNAIAESKEYYVLDQDITIQEMIAPIGEFQGVLDGQGHTITFAGDRPWVFQNLGEEGVLQNLHFTGTISNFEASGPIGHNLQGSIINCFSEVKGDFACGFAKRLKGGSILNSYSISEGKKGTLINQYDSGTLVNTYWQEGNVNPVQIPPEALTDSSAKSEEQMKTKEFVNLLNQNKGTYGTEWGQNSNGYPYFGADQEYNPDKPNLPENKYDVVMVADGETEIPVENQTFTISPDEIGNSQIAGRFKLKDVPETSTVSWGISEVKPEKSLMIGADQGELRVNGEGSGIVTATERKQDGTSEAVAWVKVIAKAQKLEEIQLVIDGKDVTNQQIQVSGSEEKRIEVKAKYQGSDTFVPANSTRFSYKTDNEELIKNLNESSVFSFKKPGTAKMIVTSKADTKIRAEVEVTSTYVPVVSVKPAISGEKVLHARNANDPDHYAFLPDYSGVMVTPENASYADSWTVTSSDSSIAEYVDSMVKGYVPYQAGTVTYTASIEQTNPESRETSCVSGTSEVTYVYQNPLTEIDVPQKKISMENFKEIPLELTFKGEISEQGWSVTYPEMEWTYDREGIVKIFKKEIGIFKKGSQWEGAPDYGMFLTSDQYYVTSYKEGTVTVTGTPLDKTNQIEPVTFTIQVAGGEAPQVDNDALVAKGTQGALEHLDTLYPEQNYQYNDNDWIVYGKLRRGETIPEENLQKYYDSVVKEVKTWKKTKKPTDIERIVLVLSVMEKDITDVGGVNLAELIYNHPNLDAGSNELAWGLLALDAEKTRIPADAKWSRDKMLRALLTFQNPENGGFGLTDNSSVGADTTAMALQALAPYRDTDVQVHRAVEKGLAYLKNTLSESCNFATSESTAQLLLTLTVLHIDPLNSEFGVPHNNTITGLMEYYCETVEGGKGFCHDKGNKKLNTMSSVQALQAFTAYEMYKKGEKTYWDLTEGTQNITAADVEGAIAKLPETEKLTLEDEAVILGIKAQYDKLSEEEKKKVKNIGLLNAALKKMEELKALGKEVGSVSVSIMDGIKKELPLLEAAKNTNMAKGVILDTKTAIFEKDSMMSIIKRCCEQNGIEISIRQGTYIEGIDGLLEFDRGPGSGWKGTLDGVFPDKSFAECTVQAGEVKDNSVITVEYTENLGKDLEENAELKTPGLQGGKLKENFERNRYEYTLITEEKEISFTPEFFNRYSVATIKADGIVYGEKQKLPVKDGLQIQLVSEKNVRGKDSKTYIFHVEKQEGEPGNTEEDQKAANTVIEKINQIGDKITLESKAAIEEARKAYEKLSEEQKKLVSNYDKLTKAEAELKRLEEENQKPGGQAPEEQKPVVLVNKKYGVSLKGEGLTEDMELSVKPIGKDHADVERMRKEIPSDKSVFRLYQVKLLKNGKEISIPSKAVLSVPVGKDYEGKELTLLHCIDEKVEKLKGKVQDEMLSVEVSSLGSIGVVIDTSSAGGGIGGGTGAGNGGSSAGKGTGVKTGDETNAEVILFLLMVSAMTIGSMIYRKKKQ